LRTSRLELRCPDEEGLVALAGVAEAGIHPPDEMPFRVAWTDGAGKPGFLEAYLDYHHGLRRHWRPDHWGLALMASRSGEPIGSMFIGAERFAENRVVQTGSWLGLASQGLGYGTEMRAAVLELAFAGLGARTAVSGYVEGNVRSARVSEKLGYVVTCEDEVSPRGVPVRELVAELTVERWDACEHGLVEITGLGGCLPLFGVT
jgi:RimJ/RimL family protein N-acetyltransferase